MSRYTPEQRHAIMALARANLAEKTAPAAEPRARTQPSDRRKTHAPAGDADDGAELAAAASAYATAETGADEPWWKWTERHVEYSQRVTIDAVGEALGRFQSEAHDEVAALRRELELLRQELTVLREQAGLERELRSLRSEVEDARAQVPKVPAIAARLEAGQARLLREVETTKDKLSRVRTNQCITDYRLAELRKATEARAAGIEMKFETSISMREIHPDARVALRDFAGEALKGNRGETLWFFDSGPTGGTA